MNETERLETSIRLGIEAEEDWYGPSIKPGVLTDEQIHWLAAWIEGDRPATPKEEVLAEGVWCEDCECFEEEIEDGYVRCPACGCYVTSHRAVKVVPKVDES